MKTRLRLLNLELEVSLRKIKPVTMDSLFNSIEMGFRNRTHTQHIEFTLTHGQYEELKEIARLDYEECIGDDEDEERGPNVSYYVFTVIKRGICKTTFIIRTRRSGEAAL